MNTQPYLIFWTSGEVDINICLLLTIRTRHPDTLTLPFFFQTGHLSTQLSLNLVNGGDLDLNICLLSISRIRHPDTFQYFFQICRLIAQPNLNLGSGGMLELISCIPSIIRIWHPDTVTLFFLIRRLNPPYTFYSIFYICIHNLIQNPGLNQQPDLNLGNSGELEVNICLLLL